MNYYRMDVDPDMHLFVERGLHGGISMASKRYAKANNPLIEGFDPEKPASHILYLDVNNLYGWAMSKPLPMSGFKWRQWPVSEDEVMEKPENAKKGWIIEVDLAFPSPPSP